MRNLLKKRHIYLPVIFGALTPSLVIFILEVSVGHVSPVRSLDFLFVGGLVGILVLMVFGHVAVWYPLYGGGHMSSTAVIAFFFIPFYCIAAMGIGLLIGWVISRLSFSEM